MRDACLRFLPLALIALLAACEALEPPPTATPTRAPSGPTMGASQVFRGEFPTEAPALFQGQNDPTAAALPSGGALPPLAVDTVEGDLRQTIQVTTHTGATLPGELYSAGEQRLPGLLMLAPGSDAWLDLPLRLQAAGFTVLTMSSNDVADAALVSDVLASLSDVGTVDPGSMGVVGAEAGADVALLGCAQEMLCDVVALISPTQHDPLLVAMQRYNPRSLFVAAGEGDAVGAGAARALDDYAQGESALELGPGASRGAFLLQDNPTIGDRLIEWLRGQF